MFPENETGKSPFTGAFYFPSCRCQKKKLIQDPLIVFVFFFFHVLVLCFSLDYSEHFHILHIFANRYNSLRSIKQTPPFFPSASRMVICRQSECDVTDKRYGPVIQPFVGRRINKPPLKRLRIEPT